MIDEGFIVADIAKLLSVSVRTIYRRMQQYNITKHEFLNCSENDLDKYVAKLIKDFPFCGEHFLGRFLKRQGIHVQRYRLRESIHRLDEFGVKERKRGCLHRRVYSVQGPNHLWYIDTNHKLIRWGLVIAGGIDGFSRLITFLKCADNNKANTLLKIFQEGINSFGIPNKVRSDKGMENVAIADYMIAIKGNGSMNTGKSVHNQRIERLWRDVYTGVLCLYYNLFYHMEDEGILDPLNDQHTAALQYTFIKQINHKLDVWRDAWASHRMRTTKASPITLWVGGQMQNPVGIDQDDLEINGSSDSNEAGTQDDNRPIIDSVSSYIINEQCYSELNASIPSLWISDNFGIDIYQKALEIINRHTV